MASHAQTQMPGEQRFASPAIREAIGRRMAEIGGISVAALAIGLGIALYSYHAADASLNTATSVPVRNLAGPVGAYMADMLWQGFGFAAVLPSMGMLAWAWRIASRRGLGLFPLRLIALLLAVPALAMTINLVNHHALVPTNAGPGGAMGLVLATTILDQMTPALHALAPFALFCGGFVASVILIGLGFGLSWGEWRGAGRRAAGAARVSVAGGRQAAQFVTRVSQYTSVYPRDDEDEPRYDDTPLVRPRVTASVCGAAPVAEAPKLRERAKISKAEKKRVAPSQTALPLEPTDWECPPVSLLATPPVQSDSGPSEDALQANARQLEAVLAEYGVQGTIREIRPGPVVTLYELEPAPGIRSARVIGLADDVARSMSVTAVRIAVVPGRNVIGIEVPNQRREIVYLAELMDEEPSPRHGPRLMLALGKDISGSPVVADLSRMPHLLIAGTTGSGKSVGINAMILSLVLKLSPDQCRLILIDPKMLELSVYEGIPHLLAPVVTEPAKAVVALKWVVREMERRYRAMSQLGVRNVGGYNDRVEDARSKGEVISRRVQTGFDTETGRPTFEEQPLTLERLPFIVVVIDEMADLMMVAGKDIETAVQRLAQMARAAGIHVIMATQRPSVDVITGTIKANFPTRVSYQVISKFDSRTILGEQGAEQLLGHGDMLYMQGGGRITRVHGPLVTDQEVEDIVAFLRAQGEPEYLEEVTELAEDDGGSAPAGFGGDAEVTLFDQAVALVAREGKISISFIQRHFNIGYNKAAKLVEQMEKEGIVSQPNHTGKREILTRRTYEEE